MQIIRLNNHADFEGWRHAARQLLQQQVTPEAVLWQSGTGNESLFQEDELQSVSRILHQAHVPRQFIELCRRAIQHKSHDRLGLMYRLLWRLQSTPGLLDMAFDPDVSQLRKMVQAVHRDQHKMKAFVRFREIKSTDVSTNASTYVAWYEPEHCIVEAMAEFFIGRFTNMRWSILTPMASLYWDGAVISVGPGKLRSDMPTEDTHEELWRTYYSHIFNPSRLKLKAMQAQMPRKFWRNLPEASLIKALTLTATHRMEHMMAAVPQPTRRKIVKYQAMTQAKQHPEGRTLTEPEQQWKAFFDEMSAFKGFPLAEQATQLVRGDGPVPATLMFVGEQPGDKEDIAGKPFVGPAGKLLSRALADAGLDRETCYITNAVKHFEFRLVNGRRRNITPTAGHIADYRPWLEREIAIVQPQLIIALGAVAIEALLGRKQPVLANRGKTLTSTTQPPVLVTVHPSSILRAGGNEAAYRAFVDDLKHARQALDRS